MYLEVIFDARLDIARDEQHVMAARGELRCQMFELARDVLVQEQDTHGQDGSAAKDAAMARTSGFMKNASGGAIVTGMPRLPSSAATTGPIAATRIRASAARSSASRPAFRA